MQSIQDLISQTVGEQGLLELGQRFGLDAATTNQLVGKLAPTIAGGVRRKAQQEGGMAALLENLRGERQARYVDAPSEAATSQAKVDGEAFLKNVLGANDASERMATAAADRTGATMDAVIQFLPAFAAIMQGVLQRNAPDTEIGVLENQLSGGADRAGAGINDLLASLGGGGGGGSGGVVASVLGGLLGGGRDASPGAPEAGGQLGGLLAMLDRDGDGSPLDDVLQSIMR